jgi:hypothetical protein
VTIGPVVDDERAYCAGSWAESYKLSPGHQQLPWGAYKRVVVPELKQVLDSPATSILAARSGGQIVGWLALSRGRRIHACHWVHTRFRVGQDGEQLRRRGVMTALFEAAQLGHRFIYTHRGPVPRHGADRSTTSDEWIAKALAERGVFATFVHYQEWIR